MVQTIKLLMNLVRHRLRPELGAGELPESITPETAKKLMELAQMHSLTAIVGSELMDQNLLPPGDLRKEIQQNVFKAVFRCNNLVYQQQWLSQILEEAGIPFMPLKGSVIRCYYPEPWLRTSCDIDILVHPEQLEAAVSALVSKGCRQITEKKLHDISLVTPGKPHLELHFNLRENVPAMDQVLDRVWENSQLSDGKRYEYRQSNTFLMFHLIAHMAYHCYIGGSGIRSFVDIWLLRDMLDYDSQMLHQLCSDAGLEKFYVHTQYLIDVWFCEKEHTPISKRLEQFVICGGTFGSVDNLILVDQAQTGKGKRLRRRVFLPYEGMKTLYPILEEKRWMTPAFQVVRWFSVMTDGRFGKAVNELRISQKHSNTQIDDTKRFLEEVGLDFSHKQ